MPYQFATTPRPPFRVAASVCLMAGLALSGAFQYDCNRLDAHQASTVTPPPPPPMTTSQGAYTEQTLHSFDKQHDPCQLSSTAISPESVLLLGEWAVLRFKTLILDFAQYKRANCGEKFTALLERDVTAIIWTS